MPDLEVPASAAGERLDRFLAGPLGSRARAQRLIDAGQVRVDGTAALLRARDHDAAAVRREVASPGGYTERGLRALEEAGVPEALHQAMDVVTAPRRP